MARVCVDWFPETNGFYMDDQLKLQLDVLLKNVKNDWDFTIIVTGQGEVRVGKSKLGMDIACYWSYEILRLYKVKVPFNVKDNYVFDGQKLIEIGNRLGQNHPMSALVYDEAGSDLEGRKSMQTATQNVLDYFRECGQYNLLNVLILPEYFDLPKGIALSRSIFLIDVYYSANEEGLFLRGFFNFYSKRQKKNLYLRGKRNLDYHAAKYDFHGKFYNFYQVNEKEYRQAKQDALTARESNKKNKWMIQRDALMYLITERFHVTQEDLAHVIKMLCDISLTRQSISDSIQRFKLTCNHHAQVAVATRK